jgi:hypothetical protein
MSSVYLQYKPKISLNKSIDKIVVYAIWGDHTHQPRPKNKGEVTRLLSAMGFDLNKSAEECRNYKIPIPFFENLIKHTWDVHTYNGGKASIVDRNTDDVIAEIKTPGMVAFSTYLAQFETACSARDRAVGNSSFMDFQTAIVHGIASIESYINEHTQSWNQIHPNDKLIDSKHNKVSFDDKLNSWIPKISGGNKIAKNDQRWNDFMTLRKVRDKKVIHSKQSYQTISYSELTSLINAFRLGIAGMLGQLHLIFSRPLPSIIINSVYMPDVELCKNTECR